MKKFWLINFPALLVLSFACGQNKSFEQMLDSIYTKRVPLILSADVASLKEQNKEVVFLDVRSKEEYQVSHIEGAKLVDYDTFSELDVAKIDRSQSIIVYCSVGYRSERVGEQLIEMGFKDVKNIYGGIFDWKNTDHVVVDANGQPTDRVHTYNKRWSKWLTKGIKVYE